jgi:hypothetical protein
MSTKTKHTPGPWIVRGEYSEEHGGMYSINQTVESADAGLPFVQLDEINGNAALIAAAPEMLEALELLTGLSALGKASKFSHELSENECIDKALAAITKAKGGAK